MVLYIKHSLTFLGLCKDVKIAIRGLKIRYSIFVVEAGDHDLMMDQLFFNFVKFC